MNPFGFLRRHKEDVDRTKEAMRLTRRVAEEVRAGRPLPAGLMAEARECLSDRLGPSRMTYDDVYGAGKR